MWFNFNEIKMTWEGGWWSALSYRKKFLCLIFFNLKYLVVWENCCKFACVNKKYNVQQLKRKIVMGKLIKIFFIILILIFLIPMIWFLLKELFWFFGFSIAGLFSGIFVGTEFGWFLLFVIFVVIIIWLLTCDWVICLTIYWFRF